MVDKAMREVRSHGNMMFPISYYEWHGLNRAGLVIECHWHEEWELLKITKGCALLTINGQQRLMQEGDIAFVPGNIMHLAEPFEDIYCRYTAIVFKHVFLTNLCSDIVQSKYFQPVLSNKSSCINFVRQEDFGLQPEMIFDRLYNALAGKGSAYELYTKAYLYELIGAIFEIQSKVMQKDHSQIFYSNTEKIKNALNYINTNYSQPIQINQLSELSTMSPSGFTKFFKMLTTMTPIEYVNNVRLSKAADMLSSTEKKIIDIAEETGFNNISYFIRTFKKNFGCPPQQYRLSNGQKLEKNFVISPEDSENKEATV